MSNFSQNNVNFTIENNFQTGEKKHPIKGKLTSAVYDYLGYESDDASKLINAVEIDWNKAELNLPEVFGGTQTISTTGQLLSIIQQLANAINNVHTKIDPTLKISNPTSTTIADGNYAIIRVTSNVEGMLELTTSSGDGWRATSNSAATPEVSHSIVITNVTTIATAGSIAAGDIVAKFTPTDTTNYNTLTDQSVLKQNITLSAAQPQVTYYWYVGQTDPSTISSITSVVSDTSSPGWRLIGSSIGTYTLANPLWDGAANSIITGESKATTYIALPNTTLKMRDSEGDVFDFWINNGTKTINNVTYTIYQADNIKIFNGIIF